MHRSVAAIMQLVGCQNEQQHVMVLIHPMKLKISRYEKDQKGFLKKKTVFFLL